MGHTKCQNAIKQKRKTRIRLLCIFFFVSNEALLTLVLTREKSLPEKLALLTFTQKIINTRVRATFHQIVVFLNHSIKTVNDRLTI